MDMIKIHASRNVNSAAQVLVEHYPSGYWLVVSASPVFKETAIFPAVARVWKYTHVIDDWEAVYANDLYTSEDDMQTVLNRLNDGTLSCKKG